MPNFMELADPITPRDMRAFDPEAKELVADFQAAGWRGFMSRQGHAIMLAPDGTTSAAVSGHSGGPHLAKWARAELKRWKRAQENGKPSRKGAPRAAAQQHGASFSHSDKPNQNGHATPASQNGHATPQRLSETSLAPTEPYPGLERVNSLERPYRCTDAGCAQRPGFHAIGPAILHRQRAHDGLKCKDCGKTFPLGPGSAKDYSAHRMKEHGAKPPKKSKRLRGDEDGMFRCEWCGKPFTSPQGRAGHRKKHMHNGETRPAKPPVWRDPAADVVDVEPAETVVEPAEFDAAEQSVTQTLPPAEIETVVEPAVVEPPAATVVEPPAVVERSGPKLRFDKQTGKWEPAEIEPPAETATAPAPAALPATSTHEPALDDLDAWVAGQDPTKMLTSVLTVVAPPLLGEIERLRSERDGLRARVTELETIVEEHQAWLSLLPSRPARG